MVEYDVDVLVGIVMILMEVIVGWFCKIFFWLLMMGLVCCVIEMIFYGGLCVDVVCWGYEVFWVFFCQVDFMIVLGWVSQKMVLVVCQFYD